MSDYNEITAVITTDEPEIAATLDELRFLVFKGKQGDTGDSAYEEAVQLGFEGTEEEWLASLKGEQGEPGKAKSAYLDYDVVRLIEDDTIYTSLLMRTDINNGVLPFVLRVIESDSAEEYFELDHQDLSAASPVIHFRSKEHLLEVDSTGHFTLTDRAQGGSTVYVTPEQFGAIGDGVTDDTVALQTAVRAGNVVCEAGKTYLISKPILFSSHIYDFGGCTIKLADNYEKNAVEIDGVPYGYIGLVFDDLENFCVKNLTLDCNKAGNGSTAITGAIFSDSTGVFENCTFQDATYKHLVINRGNDLKFFSTTLRNLGTAANSSDVYVSGTPESSVTFNGVTATRESGNTSTGQVFYINTGNVAVSDAYIENCHIFTDSRSGNTTVRDAVVYNAKNLAFIDQDSSRDNPANITYENVRFYDLERTSGGYGVQVGGVSSLSIDNMYVQFASASTFSHAVYFQSSYGKLNRNIRINGLRMDLGSVALQNALYFSGDDTTENVLLTDCHFALASMTRAYIARIANNPKNVRIENCTFDNFQFQWVYGNTNQHLLGVSNATPRRAATADLPTLTTADTGSIIYDTTLGIFKLWNGSAWIDPRPSVPVQSVNGKTGSVMLTAADVNALPSSTVIPTVPQMATDPDMEDWDTGKIVDAAVLKSGFNLVGNVLSRKANASDIPTAVSELTNDSGFQTASDVQTAIAGKADKTPRVAMTAADEVVTINPNTEYVFPEMAQLRVTLGAITDNTILNEFHFFFESGATPTLLGVTGIRNGGELPDPLEANKLYEFSSVEGIALLVPHELDEEVTA